MPEDMKELLRWSLIDGEALYPIEYFEGVMALRYESTPGLMSTQQLLQCRVRVAEREGANLIRYLTWWMRSFIVLISLVLLTSAAMLMHLNQRVSVLNWFSQDERLWILTSLVAGFSMGRLVQKAVSYGWRRWLRLWWLVVIRKPFMKGSDFQESLRTERGNWRSVGSSLNSNPGSSTYSR
jgi:hypothetical protein